jgi:hypothetical protein
VQKLWRLGQELLYQPGFVQHAAMNAYTPYTEQWNFTIQRDLGRGRALEVGYVGSHYVGGLRAAQAEFVSAIGAPEQP